MILFIISVIITNIICMHTSNTNIYLLDTVDTVEPKPLLAGLAASWFSLAWLHRDESLMGPVSGESGVFSVEC